MTDHTESTLAGFVKAMIAMLEGERSLEEISAAAGYDDPKTLVAIGAGRIKLPIDRAPALADALGVDRRDLLLLALRQFLSPDIVSLLTGNAATDALRSELRATAIAVQVEAIVTRDLANGISVAATNLLEDANAILERQMGLTKALDLMLEKMSD